MNDVQEHINSDLREYIDTVERLFDIDLTLAYIAVANNENATKETILRIMWERENLDEEIYPFEKFSKDIQKKLEDAL